MGRQGCTSIEGGRVVVANLEVDVVLILEVDTSFSNVTFTVAYSGITEVLNQSRALAKWNSD